MSAINPRTTLRDLLQQRLGRNVPDVSSIRWNVRPEDGLVDVAFNIRGPRGPSTAVVRTDPFPAGTSVHDETVLTAIAKSDDWDAALRTIDA